MTKTPNQETDEGNVPRDKPYAPAEARYEWPDSNTGYCKHHIHSCPDCKTGIHENKRYYYKTAEAIIACAYFKAGQIVAVKYDGLGQGGVHYFTCSPTSDFINSVEYPEHHLTRFVL